MKNALLKAATQSASLAFVRIINSSICVIAALRVAAEPPQVWQTRRGAREPH